MIQNTISISSPFRPYMNYTNSIELKSNQSDLWWSVDQSKKEITFELHCRTTGWVALGISQAGGMANADIVVAWIDSSGQLHLQDRFSADFIEPIIDNTTMDWIGLNGREENGWTIIQFKRLLDTCDIMDVPIKSGTNILIYAYSTIDPMLSNGRYSIEYHGDRRYTIMIPLTSYNNPPNPAKLNGLERIDFRLNNYLLPASSTFYHCKIYKAPMNYSTRRHAIAYEILIDPNNFDLVHHILLYECSPMVNFNDNDLPNGGCDEMGYIIAPCSANIATGWAVGGNLLVEYPQVAGYPIGGNFSIRYYMVQIHYDNPRMARNRTDSSGIRFYLGSQLRQYDLGYLTVGTVANELTLNIPPNVDRFMIDSYCSVEATSLIPANGITILSTFPHTHMQGRSLWTKIIRNQTARKYLFNAEYFNFNYQFQNILPQPIQLYPGDELATRCIYNTMNKNQITLGGERTMDEMCLNIISYYPRMNNFYFCQTAIPKEVWKHVMNTTMNITDNDVTNWLNMIPWDARLARDWQILHQQVPRAIIYGMGPNFQIKYLERLPPYEDLKPVPCVKALQNESNTSKLSSIIIYFMAMTLFCLF